MLILSEKEEKETGEILNRVYCTLLGERVWNQLCQYYQDEPEETLKVTQELIAKLMDTPTDK